MQKLLPWAALLLLGAATAQAGLQLQPIELRIGGNAAQPSVAVDPRAGFVLTWQERSAALSTLSFAVIDKNGAEVRRGTIASGADWFVNGADFPSLVVLDNGDWVSYWLQKTAPDTYAYAIRAVRSRDGGRSWEAPITIHRDGTDTEHGFVALSSAGGDRVQLAWFDGRRMAGAAAAAGHEHEGAAEHMTLRSAVLGRDGQLRQEHELDDLTCACCQTDMVRGASRTLLVYRDRSAQEIRDIGLLVQANGAWSKPRQVHADGWKIAGCPVNGPAVAARGDRYSVLWPTMAGGELQVRLAHGDGSRFEPPRTLASGAAELGRVDLATWGRHGFLVSRVRQGQGAMELVLDELDADGRSVHSTAVASKVGGFPRLARSGAVALLAWAEAGASSGNSRIGVVRITPAAEPESTAR